jgi:Flp pilus assembly protein TadD
MMDLRIPCVFCLTALLFHLAGCASPEGEAAAGDSAAIYEARRLEGAGETGAALALLGGWQGPAEGRRNCLEAAAEICLHRGQPSMAVIHLEEAIRLDPQNTNLCLKKAEALLFAGRELEAEAALRECLTLDWSVDRAKIALAGILFQSGGKAKQEQAAAFLDAVAADFDWDASDLLLLGYVRHKSGRSGEALRLFGRAAVLAPFRPRPWFDRAVVLEELNDLAGAEEAYRQALQRDQLHVPTLFNLGRILVATDRAGAGREMVDAACAGASDPVLKRSLEKTRDRLFGEER